MADNRHAVIGDEVMNVASEHALVGVRRVGKTRDALDRLSDDSLGREVGIQAGIDSHPVGLPSVLEPQLDQSRTQFFVRRHRPAADLVRP